MYDIAGVRGQARWMARQRLLDQVEVKVDDPDGAPVRDPETGEVTGRAKKIIYGPGIPPHHGACRVRMGSGSSALMPTASGNISLVLSSIVVPWDVVLPRLADIKVVKSDNPAAVGVERTVRAIHTGSQQSTNRYGFEEVQ